MKAQKFDQAEFLLSASSYSEFPKRKLDEVAIVGRSNVGKSSLINHLLKNKKLAKVSATPGKTQLLNLFLIDDSFYFVDLPGYGYAKVPKAMKRAWSDTLDQYLNESHKLRLILLLLDSRHLPSKDDLQFLEWLAYREIPCIIIYTKMDKLKKAEKERQISKIQKFLLEKNSRFDYQQVCYSVHDTRARSSLIETINQALL